ncbi:unnamed protein product [Mytilus coruscus]|uniref:Uncharacterized protein n=1 Tax=Mytilus coruscus TaxID=42192 RepID=A0A6J8DV87_MYTCO|nr:unnamed protein product [Mytilus coruscus]
MECLEQIVNQDNIDLYNIIFKYILPLPIVHESTNRSNINDDISETSIKTEYPEIDRFLWAGSKKEGFTIPITANQPHNYAYLMSDFDLIAVLSGIIAMDENASITELQHDEIFQVKDAPHPGFVKLFSVSDQQLFSVRFDTDCSGKVHFMHNNDCKATINIPVNEIIDKKVVPLTSVTEKSAHGPALCFKIKSEHPAAAKTTVIAGTEVDVVLAVKMGSWPQAANNWHVRQRSCNWPSMDLINKIMCSAIHLVPVGHSKSDNSENEWRYSFTIPERLLAQSLSVFQRACYIMAKILLKAAFAGEKCISPYLLKTTMFWLCEEIPCDNWTDDRMGYFVLMLLYRLQCSLYRQELRHYFIPENNMVDHISPKVLSNVIERLAVCIKDPLTFLFSFIEAHKYFGFYVHPSKDIFNPLIKLCKSEWDKSPKYTEMINSAIRNLLLEFVGLYSSWLKRNIAPPGDVITRPFAELKFRLLLGIAKDIQNIDKANSIDIIVNSIANEIETHNADNATEFLSYAKSFLKSL